MEERARRVEGTRGALAQDSASTLGAMSLHAPPTDELATRELLDGSGLSLAHRGEYELKGLTGARTVYALER